MRRRRMHGRRRKRSCPMKKQDLSPTAAKAKAERDKEYMMGPYKKKKAENQRLRRAALKKGVDLTGKDYDHSTNSFVSIANNRGNFGKGTKKEG